MTENTAASAAVGSSEKSADVVLPVKVGDISLFPSGIREVDGVAYDRAAVQTHFIQRGEDYEAIVRRYLVPVCEPGDFVTVSEKIVSMCQDNTVEMKDVKVGFWAKFLSKFATSNDHGIAMDEPYKLQLAIDMKGLPLILWACFCHVIGRLFGKRGVFYEIVGQEVAGIDGFYSHSSFDIYHTLAVLLPKDPDGVCKQIEEATGVATAIVDANDLNVEILGKSPSLDKYSNAFLAEVIRDNPAGQDAEHTPFVRVRRVERETEEA